MKKEILKRISAEEALLHDEDAEGHIWWNRFREFIEAIQDPAEALEEQEINVDLKNLTVEEDRYKFGKKK